MFRQIPRRMPFLAAETALALGRHLPVLGPRRPKQAWFWGRDSGAILGGSYGVRRPATGFTRAKTGLPSRPTITGGFPSKRYRKGTRLVQVHPVNGWIWCSWNERQNVGGWTKPLTCADPFA